MSGGALDLEAVALGPLTPLQHLELLCDRGSLTRQPCERSGDALSVVCAMGRVGGRTVACYAQDPRVSAGALGSAEADSITRLLRLAGEARIPVVSLIESAGARIQEAVGGLAGYARVFRETVRLSRVVPQISVVTGTCAGGGAYLPALTDFVVMTEAAAMFLTGPGVVRRASGEEISRAALGGARVHERNGVCDVVTPTEWHAIAVARDLLSYLPDSVLGSAPVDDPVDPPGGDPARHLPDRQSAVYDTRDVLADIVDGGELLELGPKWARNVVTALARIEGRPLGVIASQPRHIGGVIDVQACDKAVGFIETCDRYGLPLVIMVDTPGFMASSKQEWRGIIAAGARLVNAFARASVPRFTVVTRKAYGGAYIAMNAKDLGATRTFAWPEAEIGIMDASSAIRIVKRRDLAGSDEPERLLAELARSYAAEHSSAAAAARSGYIDEVVEPPATRARLAAALAESDVPETLPAASLAAR